MRQTRSEKTFRRHPRGETGAVARAERGRRRSAAWRERIEVFAKE